MKHLKQYETIEAFNEREFVMNLKHFIVHKTMTSFENKNLYNYQIYEVGKLRKQDRDVELESQYAIELNFKNNIPTINKNIVKFDTVKSYSSVKKYTIFTSNDLKECITFALNDIEKIKEDWQLQQDTTKYNI